MNGREAPRGLLVLIGVLAIQLTVVLNLRIWGAHPDLMMGVAVGAGLAGGTERGAIFGFFSGIALDLFLPTPFGLSALVGTALGAGAGRLVSAGIDRSAWFFVPLVALIGSAIGVIMFAVLGTILGQPHMLTVGLLGVLVVVGVTNAILAPAMLGLCGWVFGEERTGSAWHGPLVSGDSQ